MPARSSITTAARRSHRQALHVATQPAQQHRNMEQARPPYSRYATLRQSGDVCHDDERSAESGKRYGGDTSGTDRPAGHRRQPFRLGRERSVTFLLASGPEFPEPAGAVSAGVFRLGALECVRHSPALFFCQNRRCVF